MRVVLDGIFKTDDLKIRAGDYFFSCYVCLICQTDHRTKIFNQKQEIARIQEVDSFVLGYTEIQHIIVTNQDWRIVVLYF